jgi:sugar lactone lactonase YvrE
MKLFCSCRLHFALALAIGCLIATGGFLPSADVFAQTPAITVPPVINTIAGNGTGGYGGDGGSAINAELNGPGDMAVDAGGNVYIADAYNSRIRKIDPSGIISTIAGNGSCVFGGDGGPSTSAMVCEPYGVAVDAVGNLYVADTYNNRIREINASGIISTIAGNGTGGFSGDGGPATSAEISEPTAVAVDSTGHVYIADRGNYRIRKIDPSGTISTIAGTGTIGEAGDGGPALDASFDTVWDVAVNAAGDVYIADVYDNVIRKIDHTTQIISKAAGTGSFGFGGDGGPATSALVSNTYGVSVDAAGNVYISDTYNQRVRKIDTNGIISTIAGNGTASFGGDGGLATSAELNDPYGITVDASGNVYIADINNERIRKVRLSISPAPFPGTSVGQTSSQNVYLVINQPVTISSFSIPQSEGGAHEYAVGTVTGCPIGSALTAGTICTIPVTFSPAFPGLRDVPLVVTTTIAGEFSFGLTGTGTAPQIALLPGIIQTVAGNGTSGFSGDNGPATAAGMTTPAGVARDSAGNMYIATYDNRIRKVAPGGTITTVAGNGTACVDPTTPCGDGGPATSATFITPDNLAADSAGNLYISDTYGLRVRKVDANGTITTIAGNGTPCADSTTPCGDGGPATSAQLGYSFGIVLDGNENLFIADQTGYRIRKVTPNGIITTIAGTGVAGFSGDNGPAIHATLTYPLCLAIDSAGNLYITDAGNQRVRRVDAMTGVITTVAGGGSSAIPDDGAPATSVLLPFPYGITLDASGSFYVTDFESHSIAKVDAATGTIRRVAGTAGSAGFTGDGGPATLAQLNQPTAIALDSFGNAYVADFTNNRVRQVSAAAAPASFPDTVVGQTSPTQAVTVSNIGNSDLSINTLTATADFLVDSSGTCSGLATLATGASCNLALRFHPQQTGARTGNFTIADDALNVVGSTQQVVLSGNGLPVATATSLVLSTAFTIGAGTPVILTADVTPYTAGNATATGTMGFYEGAALLGTAPISTAGEASITVSTFAVGTHTVTAVYGGDSNFVTSTSSPVSLIVDPPPIAVSLVSSPNPSGYGHVVTFTATVPSGATGTIQFMSGAVNLGGPVTIAAGVAAFATRALTQGTHSITAVYSGDSSHAAATSDVLLQLVIPAILTVTANPSTRTFNQPNATLGYTITGFIGSDTEAGSVTGSPVLSTPATAASAVGSYPIVIGLGTLSSSSYTFMFVNGLLTVTRATPGAGGIAGVVLTSSINPSSRGESVTFTATLPANATGQVTFMDGTVVLGTATIIDEVASLSTSQLAITTHPITAVYGGDTNYNGANSAVLLQVVNKSTLDVIANDVQRDFGQPNPAFTTTITGFVGGDTLAVVTGAPSTTTTATPTSPVGVYPIVVTQGTLAAANYIFAFLNGRLDITPATPGIGPTDPVTVAPSLNPAPFGSPVTFTMTVPAGATGTVSFFDNGRTLLGTAAIAGNTASLTISTLALGTHTITAVYNGDPNFTTATVTLSEVVISAADFTVASSTGRQLIPPGASANFTIVVSSMNGPFTNSVSMSASNPPPGATYTFNPAALTPGAAGTNTTFTVSVPPQSSMASRARRLGPVAFALLLLPFACLKRYRRRPQRLLLWMLVALGSLAAVSGCGEGGYFSQPQQTYTITVIGTSGTLVRSTTVTLTVE